MITYGQHFTRVSILLTIKTNGELQPVRGSVRTGVVRPRGTDLQDMDVGITVETLCASVVDKRRLGLLLFHVRDGVQAGNAGVAETHLGLGQAASLVQDSRTVDGLVRLARLVRLEHVSGDIDLDSLISGSGSATLELSVSVTTRQEHGGVKCITHGGGIAQRDVGGRQFEARVEGIEQSDGVQRRLNTDNQWTEERPGLDDFGE